MGHVGVFFKNGKVHGPCWGLFQKWKSSWMITVIPILAMVGEFTVQSSGNTRMGGIYDFDKYDGCDGKMIVIPKFRRANLV
jgi:hypothetical protein